MHKRDSRGGDPGTHLCVCPMGLGNVQAVAQQDATRRRGGGDRERQEPTLLLDTRMARFRLPYHPVPSLR